MMKNYFLQYSFICFKKAIKALGNLVSVKIFALSFFYVSLNLIALNSKAEPLLGKESFDFTGDKSLYSNFYSRYGYDNLNDYYDDDLPDRIFDPFEGVNRIFFDLNMVLDTILLEPAAEIYKVTVPAPARKNVDNFFKNSFLPISMANSILQGELGEANKSFWRFMINTTFGFLGLVDIASSMNLPYVRKDFDSTLASYGVPQGPYLVLPVFGPSSLRDFPGVALTIKYDPVTRYLKRKNVKVMPLAVLNARSAKYNVIKTIKVSIDPYVRTRSLYVQNKNG